MVVGQKKKKAVIVKRCEAGLGGERWGGRAGLTSDPFASLRSGLRCYAKFHRNSRVTRRKGRCVEPETANGDQGSFINV